MSQQNSISVVIPQPVHGGVMDYFKRDILGQRTKLY